MLFGGLFLCGVFCGLVLLLFGSFFVFYLNVLANCGFVIIRAHWGIIQVLAIKLFCTYVQGNEQRNANSDVAGRADRLVGGRHDASTDRTRRGNGVSGNSNANINQILAYSPAPL